MADNEPVYKTSAQLSPILGLGAKRVQQLAQDGIIDTVETPKGRRYDLVQTATKYIHFLDEKLKNKEKGETNAALESEKLSAEVRIKTARAEAAELNLSELRGKMHRAEDVEAITTDHVLFLRSMLLAVPGKLAVDMSNLKTAAEMAECMESEMHYILNSLADYRYNPDEYKKRVMEREGWDNRREDDMDGD